MMRGIKEDVVEMTVRGKRRESVVLRAVRTEYLREKRKFRAEIRDLKDRLSLFEQYYKLTKDGEIKVRVPYLQHWPLELLRRRIERI